MTSYWDQVMKLLNKTTPVAEFEKVEINNIRRLIKLELNSVEKNVYLIAALIKYGQFYLNEDINSVLCLSSDEKREILQLLKAEFYLKKEEIYSRPEFPEQRVNRQNIYNKLSDELSGYESYFIFNDTLLIYTSNYYLREKTIILIDAIACLNETEYISIVNELNNPLLSLRFIDRWNYSVTENVIEKVRLFKLFSKAHQGVILANLWDKGLQGDLLLFEDELRKLLKLHMLLSKTNFLIFTARKLSMLTIKAKSTYFKKNEKLEKQLEITISVISEKLSELFPLEDYEITLFINHFFNPVNKDSIWACFKVIEYLESNFKDKVSEYDLNNFKRKIICIYPEIWEKNNGGYYFQDITTLETIELLSRAILDVYHNEYEKFFIDLKVPSLFELKKNKGDHDTTNLFLINICLILDLLIYSESNDSKKIESIIQTISTIVKEGYLKFSVNDFLKIGMFNKLGKLIDKFNIEVGNLTFVEWIGDCIELIGIIKNVNDPDVLNYLDENINILIDFSIGSNRDMKLLNIGWELNACNKYKKSLMVLEKIDYTNIKPDHYWILNMLIANSYINIAFSESDISQQVCCLKNAQNILQGNLKVERYENLKDRQTVLMEVYGWLYDRDKLSKQELKNHFNRYFNEVNTEYNFRQLYIKCLTLIRILENESRVIEYIQIFNQTLKHLENLDGNNEQVKILNIWFEIYIEESADIDLPLDENELKWLPKSFNNRYIIKEFKNSESTTTNECSLHTDGPTDNLFE
ncbi:hypothetical protein ACIQXG_06135 [Lysinibacillus sphaericus]|uniref:hypothetical protein n=1 Tax=Lysinibacillus sphaericus TaxID=1421 RepID=UPI0038110F54